MCRINTVIVCNWKHFNVHFRHELRARNNDITTVHNGYFIILLFYLPNYLEIETQHLIYSVYEFRRHLVDIQLLFGKATLLNAVFYCILNWFRTHFFLYLYIFVFRLTF